MSTALGVNEAIKAGQSLKSQGLEFDVAYTSVLSRAIKTLWLTLDAVNQVWIPVVRDYRLNERHYGGLTGLNKAETAKKHGEEQVMLWRRSYDVPPPPMSTSDPYWPGHDRRYKNVPRSVLPVTESLKTTGDRCVDVILSSESRAGDASGEPLASCFVCFLFRKCGRECVFSPRRCTRQCTAHVERGVGTEDKVGRARAHRCARQ